MPEDLASNHPETKCWLRSLSLKHWQIFTNFQQLVPIKNKSSCFNNHKSSTDNQQLGQDWMMSVIP